MPLPRPSRFVERFSITMPPSEQALYANDDPSPTPEKPRGNSSDFSSTRSRRTASTGSSSKSPKMKRLASRAWSAVSDKLEKVQSTIARAITGVDHYGEYHSQEQSHEESIGPQKEPIRLEEEKDDAADKKVWDRNIWVGLNRDYYEDSVALLEDAQHPASECPSGEVASLSSHEGGSSSSPHSDVGTVDDDVHNNPPVRLHDSEYGSMLMSATDLMTWAHEQDYLDYPQKYCALLFAGEEQACLIRFSHLWQPWSRPVDQSLFDGF